MYLGYNFGKGVLKMSEEMYHIKEDWDKNNVNPLDSTERTIIKVIDSVNKTKIYKIPASTSGTLVPAK
jgi:hypothetical protein